MLPLQIKEALREHLKRVQALHENDLKAGNGRVLLPYALDRKHPNASREWGWQWIFPSKSLSKDPRTDHVGRHHVHENSLQKAVRQAAQLARLSKPVSCHSLRHCRRSIPFRQAVQFSIIVIPARPSCRYFGQAV